MRIKSVLAFGRCQAAFKISSKYCAVRPLTPREGSEINSGPKQIVQESARAPPMKTADPELMRAINRYHVMDAIRRFGPISRVEISQFTELSATTVSAITAALLDDRLIIPVQIGELRDA